jgi:hypothetical protein
MAIDNRLERLAGQTALTGIDFVKVHEGQLELDVHFFKPRPGELDPLLDLTKEDVSIYSTSGTPAQVPVDTMNWVDGVMHLTVMEPGDFTLYNIYINNDRIDPYFNDISFSFKANCESDLDCKPADHQCPDEEAVDFPIDYQARDFRSFRRALLDFASLRYPDWKDRLEADAGVMLAEVMSGLGDELAYYQDRAAREGYLETATQRRSIRNLAKLVDYHVHDGLGASTWLDITVESGGGMLPAGMDVWAESPSRGRINFEIGRGLDDIIDEIAFNVTEERNNFSPHIWDEDDTCLAVGTTEFYIEGHHEGDIVFDDSGEGLTGKWVLLKTSPTRPDLPVRKWMVRLIEVENMLDPVLEPAPGKKITRIAWEEEQALPFEMDLTVLEIHGNLVPASAGLQMESYFIIGKDPADAGLSEDLEKETVRALEREGHDGTITYLFSLADTDSRELVWLGADPLKAAPEIRMVEVEEDSGSWQEVSPLQEWECRPSFLGVNSSQPGNPHYTLEDGMWQRVTGYQRIGKEILHIDYASGVGKTIRFGDGEFGISPAEGSIFKVSYRVGNGSRANVAADSLTQFESGGAVALKAITNPLPVENGMEAEDVDTVRKLAPDAFRAVTYRAVRPVDYAEAAERLDWVQQAGASFRWTGSWLSAFVTPDPRNEVYVSQTQRKDLIRQLDLFRQAGREVIVKEPRYVDINLKITICVKQDAFVGQVKEDVLDVLLPGVRADYSGFFSADNFTFGDSLERSVLEAVIQGVPGVRTIKYISIRRRGWHDWRELIELSYPVAINEIIRLENDPLHPERGSLKLIMEGGA